MTVAAILLAAGTSRRFGSEDKLLAEFRGAPLVTHAAQAIRTFSPDYMFAVTSSQELAEHLSGFNVLRTSQDDTLQSDSLRSGIAAAARVRCTRAIVVLGDMPGITSSLLSDVSNRATDDEPSAATDGRTVMPPVCFPASWFKKIDSLRGDRGGASLLQGVAKDQFILTDPKMLRDIDMPEDITDESDSLVR